MEGKGRERGWDAMVWDAMGREGVIALMILEHD